MLSDDVTALSEVSTNLTRVLGRLEDVSDEAFTRPEDRFRLVELIAQAGQIVASEPARGEGFTLGPCKMPDYSSEAPKRP